MPHIPRWKRLLSYFFEFHIESAPSELNPHLYVSLSRGRHQLCTANAVYSFGDLYDNFAKAFRRIQPSTLPIEDVLLLGFGLGSIPLMLEKKFHCRFRYTGVEADESVIWLAGKYALPEIESPLELHCADAFAFVFSTESRFDLICMDVFLDDQIPEEFTQTDFLEALRDLLRPGGILLYNRLSATDEDMALSEVFWQNAFLKVFPQGERWDFDGNWILKAEV